MFKAVHLGAIEVSSGTEDVPRPKLTKRKRKAPAKVVSSSEIIDLCSSGDEKISKECASPVRPAQSAEEVVEIVSTDEESVKQVPSKAPVSSNASEPVERHPSLPPTTPPPPPPLTMEESNELISELSKENTPPPALDSDPMLPVSQPEAQESNETPVAIGDVDPEQSERDTANMSLDSLQAMYKASMEGAKKLPRLKAKKSAFSVPKPTNRSRPIVFADSAPPTPTPTLQTHIYFSRTLSASKKRALSKKAESSHKASSMTATGSSSEGQMSPAVQSAATSPPVTVETSGNIMIKNTTSLSHGTPSVAALLSEKMLPDPIVKPPTSPLLTLAKEKSKSKQGFDFVLGIMKAQGYLPKESIEPRVPQERKGKAKQKEPLFLPSDESKSGTPTPRCMPSVESSSPDLTRSGDVESSSSESLLEVGNILKLPAATLPPESTSVMPGAVDDTACRIQTPPAEMDTDSVPLNVVMPSSEMEITSAVNEIEKESPLIGTLPGPEHISTSSVVDMVCDEPIVDHFSGDHHAVGMMSVDEPSNDMLNGATPEVPQAVVESTRSDAMVSDNLPINNDIVLPPIVQNSTEGFGSNADTLESLRHKDGLPDGVITKNGRDMDVVNPNLKPSLQTGATGVTVGQPLAPVSDPQPAFGNLLPAFEAAANVTSTKSAPRPGIVSNVDKDDQCATTSNGKSPTSTIDSVSPTTPPQPQIGSDMLIWNLPPPRIIRSPDVSIFDFDLVALTIPPITPSMMVKDDDLGDLDLGYPQDA